MIASSFEKGVAELALVTSTSQIFRPSIHWKHLLASSQAALESQHTTKPIDHYW